MIFLSSINLFQFKFSYVKLHKKRPSLFLAIQTRSPLEGIRSRRSGFKMNRDSLNVVAKRIRYSNPLKLTNFKERQKNGWHNAALYGYTHTRIYMSQCIITARSAQLSAHRLGTDRILLSSFLAMQDLSPPWSTDIFILSCHNSNDVQRGLDKATWTNRLAARPVDVHGFDMADRYKNTSRFGSN